MQDIETAIVDAILAGRMRPGARLGESELARLFNVSRTRVREAMMGLQSRKVVEVRARKGWYVVDPSPEEARFVFQARRVIESGLVAALAPPTREQCERLRAHLAAERAALDAGNQHLATCLMGDFHILLAQMFGNPMLAGILTDLTARTILISMLSQTAVETEASHDGHRRIVEALEAHDLARAARLMIEHIDEVEQGLDLAGPRADAAEELRRILTPAPPPPARVPEPLSR